MYVYIYIYIHTHTHIYIYIHTNSNSHVVKCKKCKQTKTTFLLLVYRYTNRSINRYIFIHLNNMYILHTDTNICIHLDVYERILCIFKSNLMIFGKNIKTVQ